MTGPTSDDLLRRGVPATAIRCVNCAAGTWDGTTPNALPACVDCRAFAGRALRIWTRELLDTAARLNDHDAARTEGAT